LFPTWVDDVGEGRNFFSREKKFRPSPTPPTHFKKSEVLLTDYLIISPYREQSDKLTAGVFLRIFLSVLWDKVAFLPFACYIINLKTFCNHF